jgi:hypothetical protein
MRILQLASEGSGGLKRRTRLGDVPGPPLSIAQKEKQLEALRSHVCSTMR